MKELKKVEFSKFSLALTTLPLSVFFVAKDTIKKLSQTKKKLCANGGTTVCSTVNRLK